MKGSVKMTIVDSWIQEGKSVIYCSGNDIENYIKRKHLIINNIKYYILQSQLLISISGIKNAIFLLDTKEKINFPLDI